MEAGAPPPPEQQIKTPQEAAASTDPAEKLEGVHAWVAQLDRKLQTRFYALAAAAVLALAAGIVAVVLALGVQDDSATKAQLEELRDQVDNATQSASDAAQDDVADLDERLSEIESQLESLRSDQSATSREISVVQDDVADLRDQIDAVAQAQEDAAATDDADTDDDTDDDDTAVKLSARTLPCADSHHSCVNASDAPLTFGRIRVSRKERPHA